MYEVHWLDAPGA